jgi:uncharacterized protein YjiK
MRLGHCCVLSLVLGCSTGSAGGGSDGSTGGADGSPSRASAGAGAAETSGSAESGAAGTGGAEVSSGGSRASGGATVLGTGGPGGTGTNTASGAAPAAGTGGIGGAATGGSGSPTGGVSSPGGGLSTGGAALGGTSSSGGTSSTGGAALGGGSSSGGASSTGGATSFGGSSSQGGATAVATPLDSFARTLGPIALGGLSNASGITWKPETDTFFVVCDRDHVLYEFSADFESELRRISLDNGGTDTEDVVYLGGNRFGVVDEENEVYVVSIPDGAESANLSAADAEHYVVSAPPATMNRGFEGVTLRRDAGASGQFIVCQEGGVTGVPIRVLFFERAASAGTFSYADGTLVVQEPWNALDKLGAAATDLAAVSFDASSSTLLVLSQETSRLLRVEPETGDILDQRELSGSPQYEGVTLADGGRLVVVSEPNFVEVYQAK